MVFLVDRNCSSKARVYIAIFGVITVKTPHVNGASKMESTVNKTINRAALGTAQFVFKLLNELAWLAAFGVADLKSVASMPLFSKGI